MASIAQMESEQLLQQGTGPYFDGPLPDQIPLVIVGKDPYPNASTTIPFCKPDWVQQLRDNTSGRHVLNSLGVPLDTIAEQYATPAALFEALRKAGVVFLNASYCPISGSFRKERHREFIDAAYKINQQFLTKATLTLFCGQAKKTRWILPESDLAPRKNVVHPDVRNRANRKTKERWHEIWSRNKLSDCLGLREHNLLGCR